MMVMNIRRIKLNGKFMRPHDVEDEQVGIDSLYFHHHMLKVMIGL